MYKTITCGCGKQEKFKVQAGNAEFCRECSTQRNRDRNRKTAREAYYRNKAMRKINKKTAVKCSCGCGNVRGIGMRFLSKYCYENAPDDSGEHTIFGG